MTTEELKKISMIDYLGSMGFVPEYSMKNGNEYWYNSPFRNEKKPSFKITVDKNTWYDFGAGQGGSIIDFVACFNRCSIREAFSILSVRQIKPISFKLENIPTYRKSDEVELRSIKKLNNKVLIGYLEERGIDIEIAGRYIEEVYYRRNGTNYFTIGMKNDSGGYEVRTKLFKGCILCKDITSIEKGLNTVSIFEGFMDFLSLLTIQKINELKSDVILLHSTSMIGKAIDKIQDRGFRKVYAFFDNDEAGSNALFKLKTKLNCEINDMRYLYKGYEDINEKLMAEPV